jgi:gas vesicle protein
MLVTGLAAGAALGVLFAPASGRETRSKLMRKGEKLREDLTHLVDQGKEVIEQAKTAASDVMGKAKDLASTATGKAKGATEQNGRTQQQATRPDPALG